MAQPSSFRNGHGGFPTSGGSDAFHTEKTQSRMSAYVDPGTRWIMSMRERDEFVSGRFAYVGTFLIPSSLQNPDDYRLKDRLLYSGSIIWKKNHRGKGVPFVIYILNTHRTWNYLGRSCFL